jgi:ATP-dependent DNA helicase RecQ
MDMLRDLRKKSSAIRCSSSCCFPGASLDMALKYPISQAELINIHVGEGKAKKYGAEFIALITRCG